jgi:hypothetical protein
MAKTSRLKATPVKKVRQRRVRVETETFEPENPARDDEEGDPDDAFARVMAEFDQTEDDLTIKVYRVPGELNVRGEREIFLFFARPSDFPLLERLRDKYGTGTYRVRVYDGNRIKRSFVYAVESLARPALTAQSSELGAMVEAMKQQHATMVSLVDRLTVSAPVDPMASLERMTAVMVNMRQLQGEPAERESSLSVFVQGIEAAAKFGSAGGGETSFLDLVKSFIESPVVKDVLGNLAGRVQPQAPAAAGQPAPQLVSHAAVPAAADTSNDQVQAFLQNVTYLVSRAANGSEPGLYAEWLLDNVDEANVRELVARKNAIDELVAAVPMVGPHRVWFARLLEDVKFSLEQFDAQEGANVRPEVPANVDSRRSGGDQGNAGGDAAAGL